MADPNQSAPPNFYNNVAQMNATGGGVTPPGGAGGGGKQGADTTEVVDAVAKILKALKKMAGMKDGAQPYVDRATNAIIEMMVDVFKADPSSLNATGDKPADAPPPAPDAGATPPPVAGAPAQ